ncbi:MAG: hypothetical protein R2865_06510 [Deinococcales bacterium]
MASGDQCQGMISTYRLGLGELQRALLEAEGISFDQTGEAGACDLSRYQYLNQEGLFADGWSVLSSFLGTGHPLVL